MNYTVGGALAGQTLYVRNGLSPNLYDLLVNGQRTLGPEVASNAVVRIANTNYTTTVEASVGYGDAGHTAAFNAAARDDGNGYTNYTLRMRNQAQTHQVEIYGTNSFAFSLGFRASPSDWNANGMPNSYEDAYGLSTNVQGGATEDADGDGVSNQREYISGTSPLDGTDYLRLTAGASAPTGFVVRFPTVAQRDYFISYVNSSLDSQGWTLATSNAISGTGAIVEWMDTGTNTTPNPRCVTNRFYRISVELPQ